MFSNQYFLDEMKELLKDDYDKFVATFDNKMLKSLRINNLKSNQQEVLSEVVTKEKTVFDDDTFYIDEDVKLGNHPLHLSGCYYLQEPSATMVVNCADIKENDVVLDLCAAPGGKSTQILNKLNNTGFLFSNEYDNKRVNNLLSNIERWGSDNYLITNNKVEDLCPQLCGDCDKVIVDAPCSGASMFKKYPESIKDYTLANVLACQKRQLNILDYAYMTLKENGILVYSTCTYNKYEDEQAVELFIKNHPDIKLVDSNLTCGVKGFDEKGFTRRVFPFNGGEGHFVAKMIKTASENAVRLKHLEFSKDKIVDKFIEDYCDEKINYTIINNKVYVSKDNLIYLKANIIRQSILLGEIVKDRIEPAHHFFLSLIGQKTFKNFIDLDEKQMNDYLHGLSLNIKDVKGYVGLCYKGHCVGFGKGDGQTIKNKYPKGLRIN